jgi:hypothetical protein
MAEAQNESATNLYVPTVDTVVAQAYRRAGLLNVQQAPSNAQLAAARPLLSDLVDKLSAEGVFMRQVQFRSVTLVLGQNQYPMLEDVIDIVGNGAYVDPTQSQAPFSAASETPVIKTDRATWQALSSKASVSRPTLAYFARQAPLSTLFLWPTPGVADAGGYVRFEMQLERPDLNTGNNTLPFERYWTSYFVFALATILAIDNSLDMNRVQLLGSQAAAEKDTAKAFSKQNVSQQARINHPTGWGRRRW